MQFQHRCTMQTARTRLLRLIKSAAAVSQQPALAAQSTRRAPADAATMYARDPILSRVAAGSAALDLSSSFNPAGAAVHNSTSSSRPTPNTVGFSESLVNAVNLTGVVLKGPTMVVYSNSGSRKVVLVLGLYERATGDRYADMARPILVEVWNKAANALKQEVKLGDKLLVKGHLALDYRPEQSTSAHGPALLVKVDNWSLVAEDSVPQGRSYPPYQGEFDSVFLSRTAAAAATSKTAEAQQPITASGTVPVTSFHQATAVRLTPVPGPRFAHGVLPVLPHHNTAAAPQSPRRRRTRMPSPVARDLLLQGKLLHEVATELGVTTGTVVKHVVEYAEEEGPSSKLWPALIAAVHLSLDSQQQQQQQQGLSASRMYDAVLSAIQDIGSDVRLKPIRDYLLSSASSIANEVQHQEAGDGPGGTYNQLKVMLAIKRLGVHPNQY